MKTLLNKINVCFLNALTFNYGSSFLAKANISVFFPKLIGPKEMSLWRKANGKIIYVHWFQRSYS